MKVGRWTIGTLAGCVILTTGVVYAATTDHIDFIYGSDATFSRVVGYASLHCSGARTFEGDKTPYMKEIGRIRCQRDTTPRY